MISALDIIDQLPLELAKRIQSDEYFANIPVVVAEKGNVVRQMEVAQAVMTNKGGNRGVCVVVLQMVADDEFTEVNLGPMKLYPTLQVIENVELNNDENGTKKSARKVARRLVEVLKPLRLGGLTTEFVPDKPCLEPGVVPQGTGESLISYLVNFYCFEADAEPLAMVANIGFATVAGQLVLSCATPGSRIFYTVDQSFPAPPAAVPGSTAQLYGGPIDIPADGYTVRACGYAGGMIASQVEWANVVPA